jgi:non-heme chloroperoxidase
VGSDKPMLLVAARDSDYWPSEHATGFSERNPNVRAAVIEQCGHAANIERPEEFNRILVDFLGGL